MLRSYGGYTWSGEDPAPLHPESHKLAGYAAMAVGGTWLANKAIKDRPSGWRAIDYLAAHARLAGNLSPFQLGNTFRVPEFASTFLSEKYRAGDIAGYNHLSHEMLSTNSTYEWLKYSTGLDSETLRSRGVVRGMAQGEGVATALHWTPTEGSRGTLEAIMAGGERNLLSHDISLFSMNDETGNLFTEKRGLNRAASAQFAAGDMYSLPGFAEHDVGASIAGVGKPRTVAPYMFGPSIIGETRTLADLGRRTNFLRSVPAFEMGRFNQLITNVSEQFLGDTGKTLFKDILKIGPGVKPGPASHMFGRYGMMAAGAGGIMIANEQLDWFRRKSIGGHALAAAVTSSGIGYLAARLGQNPRTAATIGMASFIGQMVLPGFKQGLFAGVATTGVNADLLRANPLNPVGYYRRTLEGFLPGISDWKTGALLSIGAMVGSGITLPGMKERIATKIARQMNHPMIGEVAAQLRSSRDLFYEGVGRHLNMAPEDTYGFGTRKRMLADFHARPGESIGHVKALNKIWQQSEEQFAYLGKHNSLNRQYLMPMLEKIAAQHQGGGFAAFQREIKGFGAQAYASFFGADISGDKALINEIRDMGFGHMGPTTRLGRMGALGLAVFAAQQLLTGGALGSMDDYRELKDQYAGRKLVEVKKSRFWEAGGQPFEGGSTSFFRPSEYAMMMNRVHEKSVWGEDDDALSPIHKFFTKNFTYDLEKQNYYNRPYPISSAAFEDVPIIGGLLGASIGNLIKPARLMHTGEWMREGPDGNPIFANTYRGSMAEPSYENGAIGPGRPISPNSLGAVSSDVSDQFRQLEGMTGWAKNTFDKTVFGSSSWNSDNQRLASAGEMTSWRNIFWDADMGGGFFSNEFLRRIFPRTPGDVKSYNPITNSMPAWLPDRFHYGDIYRQTQNGEARLPGPGFAALHPELQGVDPEAYPLLYRYQILGDVAPLTPEFFKAQEQIYKQRQDGLMTERENAYMDQIDSYRAQVVNQNNYNDIPKGAITIPGSGLSRGLSRLTGQILRRVAAPAEYVIPMGFRPVQKLTGDGMGAIEAYEQERMYGTPLAFWDKPIRDWLRPSMYSALHLMGYQGKPLWRAEADASNRYFDQLSFVKYMGQAQQATAAGDTKAADQATWQASQTRAGVNPQGNPLSIYWAMPAEERPYFNAFAKTTNMSERRRILEMVPEDEKNLYKTLWSRGDSGDTSLYSRDVGADQQYMDNQMQSTMREIGGALPDPSWCGWKNDVDMSDIKVRYVDNIGADLHDYGLWESDERKSMSQPFLNGSADFMQQRGLRMSNARGEIYNMLGTSFSPPQMNYTVLPGTSPRAHITYNDDRSSDISRVLSGYM